MNDINHNKICKIYQSKSHKIECLFIADSIITTNFLSNDNYLIDSINFDGSIIKMSLISTFLLIWSRLGSLFVYVCLYMHWDLHECVVECKSWWCNQLAKQTIVCNVDTLFSIKFLFFQKIENFIRIFEAQVSNNIFTRH